MTAPTVAMALGALRFWLLAQSYDRAVHTLNLDWRSTGRIGGRPAHHAAGIGEETLSLSGVIYPAYHGTFRGPEAMRLAAATMEPQSLVDGVGLWWGEWVITSVSETASHHFADGAPRRQSWSLALSRYQGPGGGLARPAEKLLGLFS